MKTLISAIFGIVHEFLKYRNSAEAKRNRAEKKVVDEAEAEKNQQEEVRRAVREKDQKSIAKILSCCAIMLSVCAGCITDEKVIYTPADRTVEPMTNSVGVVGWFVADTVFEELLIDHLRVQKLDNENKVNKLLNEERE
jgi:hypothetical protein